MLPTHPCLGHAARAHGVGVCFDPQPMTQVGKWEGRNYERRHTVCFMLLLTSAAYSERDKPLSSGRMDIPPTCLFTCLPPTCRFTCLQRLP
mmetsp:Transcript_29331/g.66385  ORF Transcript_29331/g.66385 Transcript_29331/m.66385 type:complete len:91 (+) Transcript_29331:170-442(+)